MDNGPTSQQYFLLTLDGIQLCFPKQEGTLIDLASAVQTRIDSDSLSVGTVSHDNKQWPVFSMHGDFSFSPRISNKHKFCINFGTTSQQSFSLLCDEISNIKSSDSLSLEPLPICMQTPLSPITQLFTYHDQVVFMVNQDKLNSYIKQMDRECG